jgi:hypothetical protein
MMDFFLPLLSALSGLVLINCTVLVKSHTCRTGWIGCLPVEVRYIAFFSFILLVALNANQWMSGNLLFPLLAVAAIAILTMSIRNLTDVDRSTVLRDGVSLIFVQVITLLFVFFAFKIHRYWLLESGNHDSLIYYYGAYWANESRLFVGSEAVRAQWGFDTFIGFDKQLYRGGTYTLAAWVQYFSPRITGNGLYFIAAYSATIAWFAVRLLSTSAKGLSAAVMSALLALTVALSTGLIGPLVNSNLATVMGGSSLMLIFALALRSDIQPNIRYVLMATWCTVGAHFYGESVFYAGLLIFLVLLFELPTLYRMLRLAGITRLVVSLILVIFVLGNIPVAQSFSSLLLFSEIAHGGDWTSWYLHQPSIVWIGSFIAGLLMGLAPSIPVVVASSVITAVSAVCLIYSRQFRVGVLALIGVSFLSVTYVEITSYQYGEHKIVHLLGPSWALAIVAAMLFLVSNIHNSASRKLLAAGRKILAVSIFACFAAVVFNFLSSSILLLNQMRGPHSLDFGLNALASFIRPGEAVLVDDNEWVGVEKFFKTHYLAFQLQHQKAIVLMPSIASDALRGGYQRNFVNDTLKDVEKVDWLVIGKGRVLKEERFIAAYGKPIWENGNYRLYRVNKKPVIVAGNGWHDCEPSHCWTMAPFQLEAHIPSAGKFKLLVDFSVFSPPEKGLIIVRADDGEILKKISASENKMELILPEGWSRLVFEPDWSISSPKELGVSEDSRKLFLAIQRVELKTLQSSRVK